MQRRSVADGTERGTVTQSKPWRPWREPLIHFFVLGLALFGLYTVMEQKPRDNANDPLRVEITSADLEWMQTLFRKQMGREPTVSELRGQVNQLIREHILSREAVAMGMDEGDIVVRRRLAQKMEFLFKDLSALTEPKEEDLRRYYTENSAKYTLPGQITFTQVFFSSEKRGGQGARQAVGTLIRDDPDPGRASALGDPSILSADCRNCRPREIKDRFGQEFANLLDDLEPGVWHGPLPSAYGLHAVFVHQRNGPRRPRFAEIKDRVKNDWLLELQQVSARKVYREIRSRYQVLVEGLPYEVDIKEQTL